MSLNDENEEIVEKIIWQNSIIIGRYTETAFEALYSNTIVELVEWNIIVYT